MITFSSTLRPHQHGEWLAQATNVRVENNNQENKKTSNHHVILHETTTKE
jgi:hypothetical protein